MTIKQPEPGDTITIRWPGGPHDFQMEFVRFDEPPCPPHEPGWVYLHGIVGETRTQHITSKDYRTLYARPVGPGLLYEMLPAR
jgi:hypothetical protein